MEGYRSGHNEAVLKTVWGKPHMGSNPIPSAIKKALAVAGAFSLHINGVSVTALFRMLVLCCGAI